MTWQTRAACRDEDPELFFPTATPGTTAYEQQHQAAARVCARCPVYIECRAVGETQEYGIWAGQPEQQARNYNHTTATTP